MARRTASQSDLLFPETPGPLFGDRPGRNATELLTGRGWQTSGDRRRRTTGSAGAPTQMMAIASLAALAAGGYTVQWGDTLSGIAARAGVSVSQLATSNGIADADRIYTGQHLTIPGSSSSTDGGGGATGGGWHVVQPGETLSGIAYRYPDVSVADLMEANGIADADHILAGSRLKIADTPAVPAPTESWYCPVPAASFVDDFGVTQYDGSVHEGIDLYAPHGSTVIAPVSGRVDQINGTIGGKQFWLYGDDGVLYIGSHMSSFIGGDRRVTAGEPLGRVGDSGNARGASPHLHFEMERGGEDINPFPHLVEACR